MIDFVPAADELARVPLFADLGPRQLKRLAKLCREHTYQVGRPIVKQGQMSGVGFFVVTEGTAAIAVDERVVAHVGPGDYFGELALISREVRTATVTAETPLRCLALAFWDFRAFVKDNPDVAWKMLEHLVELLADERKRRAAGALGQS
jgi:CRP-like cAMP-binding protein